MTEDERDKGKEEVQSLLKKYEDKVARNGRQENERNHGTIATSAASYQGEIDQ